MCVSVRKYRCWCECVSVCTLMIRLQKLGSAKMPIADRFHSVKNADLYETATVHFSIPYSRMFFEVLFQRLGLSTPVAMELMYYQNLFRRQKRKTFPHASKSPSLSQILSLIFYIRFLLTFTHTHTHTHTHTYTHTHVSGVALR